MTPRRPGASPTAIEGTEPASATSPTSAPPVRCSADVWRRFQRNKLAMVGLVIIILLVLVAVFAPLIAPYGIAERDPGAFREAPSSDALVRHRHTSAATCSAGWSTAPGCRCGSASSPPRSSLIIGLVARRHRRLLRRRLRHADHADHRHLPGHPLHRAGRRHRHGRSAAARTR